MRTFEEECDKLSMEEIINIWFHCNSIERLSIASNVSKAVLLKKYMDYFNRIFQLPEDYYSNYFVECYMKLSDKYPVLGLIKLLWKKQQTCPNNNKWDFHCLKPVMERMKELNNIYSVPKVNSCDSDIECERDTNDTNNSKRIEYNNYKKEKIECEHCGRMVTRGNYAKHQ